VRLLPSGTSRHEPELYFLGYIWKETVQCETMLLDRGAGPKVLHNFCYDTSIFLRPTSPSFDAVSHYACRIVHDTHESRMNIESPELECDSDWRSTLHLRHYRPIDPEIDHMWWFPLSER